MIELLINKVYNENCTDTMARMGDECVDLVVTSPPYDNLRSYDSASEFRWNEHIFQEIASFLSDVIKPGGVIVWVVGDATIKGSETGSSFRQALFFKDECGLNLHDTMIYQKCGVTNPSSNRCHQAFEYMFVFSKGAPNTFNKIYDVKNKYGGTKTWADVTKREQDGSFREIGEKVKIAEWGSRYNIWQISNSLIPSNKESKVVAEHPATFPEQLARDHIVTWSNKGDLVYDPFMGSGTTAKAAKFCGRDFIGSEISKEYYDLSVRQIEGLVV